MRNGCLFLAVHLHARLSAGLRRQPRTVPPTWRRKGAAAHRRRPKSGGDRVGPHSGRRRIHLRWTRTLGTRDRSTKQHAHSGALERVPDAYRGTATGGAARLIWRLHSGAGYDVRLHVRVCSGSCDKSSCGHAAGRGSSAAFEHVGPPTLIPDSYAHIFSIGLSEAGMEYFEGAPEMEVYFENATEHGDRIELWIPIR